MRFRAIILFLMMAWDCSLHLVRLIGKETVYPLWVNFPLFGYIPYEIFWTCFWGLGAIIAFTLIFASKVNVKNKTDVHVHIDKGVVEDANKKEENRSS
jgi:hypothetical protein